MFRRVLTRSSGARQRACLPSGVRISLCCRAGAPLEMKPTRRVVTPSASCFLMICASGSRPLSALNHVYPKPGG